MTTAEIKKMSVRDKIILMEEIWDSLCHDESEIESPAWHEEILEERRKKIESGTARFVSIDDLKARMP